MLSPPPGALALLLLAAVLCAFPSDVESHGSMVMPAPRNAIDSQLPAWSGGKHPMTGSIQPYNCRCANGTDECNSGQACFWFSQGCSIGCQSCDGNGTRIPGWDHCPELPHLVFSLSVDGQMYSWDTRSGHGRLYNKVNHFQDVTSSAQCMAVYHNMNVAIGCVRVSFAATLKEEAGLKSDRIPTRKRRA